MDTLATKTYLYDFYGDMLTDRQQEIFEAYFLNDLSLGEIAEQLNISRAAVQDHLKRCDITMSRLEDRLHLIEQYIKNKSVLKEILEITYKTNKDEALQLIRNKVSEFIEEI